MNVGIFHAKRFHDKRANLLLGHPKPCIAKAGNFVFGTVLILLRLRLRRTILSLLSAIRKLFGAVLRLYS